MQQSRYDNNVVFVDKYFRNLLDVRPSLQVSYPNRPRSRWSPVMY